MLEMDSERLWKIHDLGSMLGLLENQALASQVPCGCQRICVCMLHRTVR